MQNQNNHDVLAAVDLGSNSFHMIIARLRDGHFQVVDRLREMVQLRAGLDKHHYLSLEAQQRALACLERFGERIRDLPYGSVRVVGTNTLRIAHNSGRFLRQARLALGHPIEIVTGEEEARLIYLGVAHALAFDNSRRLVIDIGGGSTEFIIGEGFKGIMRESLEMGCVSFSQRYFEDGMTSASQMQSAMLAAARRIRAIQRPYRNMGWQEAVGASGTIRCVANICKEHGWSDDGIITSDALQKMVKYLSDAGSIEAAQLQGLSEERSQVIAGGVCVLAAAFDRLGIDRMVVSDGALREGLLYDLLGRIQHDDERDRTVEALARRYQIDEAHAERVSVMATQLFEQVARDWELDNDEYLHRLQWACKLHEMGLAIAHHQFHKHSAYLVAHSDLPGFSREEQHALSVMVRGQRRSFPRKHIKKLPDELQLSTQRLTVLLRLAMVFNRGRSERADTYIKLQVAGKKLTLTLPGGWLTEHPLTEADLAQEIEQLAKVDIRLKVQS
ncbi:exopolyphosphatase [Methylophaga sp. OBS4]|uniref:exopolyphosphatase n=1 Tax=Methylophaga sp. OBS4 TaxID=2991935 RepID=UPI00224CBD34|nr:exopolyphosphatase [Methylophaga sp. OBS4]MCX4186415.1 exopolyphosphatase [Methylophaga sp. OBS4]